MVLGSGGREHALAWRLARDPERPEVIVAPGNEGMARTFRCAPVAGEDPRGVVDLAREERVDLVVVGPEAPLAAGVADALEAAGVAVSGAAREPAQLETSKWFAKQVMAEAGIPTAPAEVFEAPAAALAALDALGPPWVIKADGLAAGKGVRVTSSRDEAQAFVRDCLEGGRFGGSGQRLVLERFLAGEEASVIAVCDGTRHVLLPAARDYKRAFDGDEGPNTGGMGAFAPTPAVDANVEGFVSERIVTPLLRVLSSRGTPYRGALYVGLMIGEGDPQVVEFNARFGDPETQAILPLVDGSLGTLLASAARGTLEPEAIRRTQGATVTIALVDEGYPDSIRGSGVIRGLDDVESDDVLVFHAATQRVSDAWGVCGGRAAYVTARGATLDEARQRAHAAVGSLSGHGWRARHDIATHDVGSSSLRSSDHLAGRHS
jgi:phosphoribosylamine--glycine ligase